MVLTMLKNCHLTFEAELYFKKINPKLGELCYKF